MRRVPSLFVLSLVLLLPACGTDGGSEEGAAGDQENAAQQDEPCVAKPDAKAAGEGDATTFAEGDGRGIEGVRVAGKPEGQPTVTFDRPFKVEETKSKVLRPGDGPKIKEGQDSVVNYVGINARDCSAFDSSWSRGQPQPFPLVEGQMIEGFIKGLVGQNVGSRVLVAIPSSDGYPQGNQQAGIKKGDSLLFVVDIQSATTPLAMAEGEAVEPSAGMPTVQTNDKGEPTEIVTPKSDPPAKLTSEAIIKGEGDEVTKESTVKIHYLASIWKSGKVFDSSWQPPQQGVAPQPASLPLAQLTQQAPGLVEGLVGHTVGSRVVIVMGAEEAIADPKARKQLQLADGGTVTFVVDLLSAS